MNSPEREEVSQEFQQQLMALPERKALFDDWGKLNSIMRYITAEWPHGSANAAEALKEMRSCVWLLKLEINDLDGRFLRDALISREMRVRELEAEIQSLHDWQLGLNSKGEQNV